VLLLSAEPVTGMERYFGQLCSVRHHREDRKLRKLLETKADLKKDRIQCEHDPPRRRTQMTASNLGGERGGEAQLLGDA
jgi:hypothetical protein